MWLFVKFLVGVLAYLVWPLFAARWAFDRTEQIFLDKRIVLPFEIFGCVVAAGVFFFALSAAIVLVGLWKPRKGKPDAIQKSHSHGGSPSARPVVDAGVGG